MAFILFVIANGTIFIRPWDLMSSLHGIQIYLGLVLMALFFGFDDVINQLKWENLKRQPITICVIGVFASIIISHLTIMYLGGITDGGFEFFKVLVFYLLLVGLVNTPDRLRYWLMAIAICATTMVALAVMDYQGTINLEKLTHVVETFGVNVYGIEQKITRMCGLGMFHDPNDISLLIVVTSFICLYLTTEVKNGVIRFFWLLPLPILITGLGCTQSRGGLLAAAGGVMGFLIVKYGKWAIIWGASAAVMAVPVLMGMGRFAKFSLSEGTGQARIRHWSDGLQAVMGGRLIFGVGEGMYDDYAGLVAHNSYVHAFVELGLFGGTFFFGAFFLAFYSLVMIKENNERIYHPMLERFKPFLGAILGAWCTGMLTLSRNYVPPTYMMLGMAAAYLNLLQWYRHPVRPVLYFNKQLVKKVTLASASMFVCIVLFVKTFVRF